jgi:succinoglycan biosynthesis transport protein ExoP
MIEHEESLHFLDYWRIIRSRQEIVIAVSVLVVLAGILVTYSMPRVYAASAVIQVKEETPDLPVFPTRPGERLAYDPLFLRTQYEIIQSRSIIEDTIRQLGLNEKLGKAYGYLDELGPASFERTVKLVTRSMKVRQYRDTNLIAIEILLSEPKDTAPVEAAAIANSIASNYRDFNMKRSRKAMDSALQSIHDSLKEQEQNVENEHAKVEAIRQKYKITYVGGSSPTELTPLDKVHITRMDNDIINVRLQMMEKKSLYDKVTSLSEKDLLDAAPHLVNDPGLTALVAKKRETEVQLSTLLSKDSLGPRHPDVLRAQATINELTAKINEALKGVKTGVQAEYEAAKSKFDEMEKLMEDAKVRDISSEASGYKEFDKALEDFQHAKKILDALELRYQQETIEMRIPRTTVDVIEEAKPPEKNEPVSPKFFLNILLSVVAGLMTSVGLAFFIEYLDTSVKTIEEVERYMHVPVLGVIPRKIRPFIDDPGQGAHVEAYRVLRTNIRFSKRQKDIRTLCVTSGSVGEGKSLTLFNLAYACAQLGDKILMIDSDLHRPRQHKILGVSNSVGLANVLIGEAAIEDAIIATKVPNMDFLPSGKLASGAVHGLLDTEKMSELVMIFRENYDFVLFDAPPIIGVSDASLLVGKMDGVLLVVQHRKYPRSVSNRAKDMIQNVGANLLGVVLNNINISRDYSYYYHYYSYPQQQTKGIGKPA